MLTPALLTVLLLTAAPPSPLTSNPPRAALTLSAPARFAVNAPVEDVSFSPDGRDLATIVDVGGHMASNVYDVATAILRLDSGWTGCGSIDRGLWCATSQWSVARLRASLRVCGEHRAPVLPGSRLSLLLVENQDIGEFMKLRRSITLVALAAGALTFTPACGDKKAEGGDKKAEAGDKKAKGGDKKAEAGDKKASHPNNPKALASYVVAAFKAGDADALKALIPTKADLEEVVSTSEEKIPVDEMDEIVAKAAKESKEVLAKVTAEAKAAEFDWSKAEIGEIETKDRNRKGVKAQRIQVQLTSGKAKAKLRLKTIIVKRGLILSRKPRVRFESAGGLCDRVLANMFKRAGTAGEKGKAFVDMITKDKAGVLSECNKQLSSKPESKKQMECQATAATFDAIMACPK